MPRYLFQGAADSKGQQGPTLQKLADRAGFNETKRKALEGLFDTVAPISIYSGEAEGASPAMKKATKLADIFSDWFVRGTPTINMPWNRVQAILDDGKFKNQMELSGHQNAWSRRMEVEKNLAGIPMSSMTNVGRPATIKQLTNAKNILDMWDNYSDTMDPLVKELFQKDVEGARRLLTTGKTDKFEFPTKEGKLHPVYGHIYNPQYTRDDTAGMFGDVYAQMSDYVKDNSSYVLGDSFYPFVEKLFSAKDMRGETSALERALFSLSKNAEKGGWEAQNAVQNITSRNKFIQQQVPYMEMWVPNHLATTNNIDLIHAGDMAFSPKTVKNAYDYMSDFGPVAKELNDPDYARKAANQLAEPPEEVDILF